jgi:hypothetical protein
VIVRQDQPPGSGDSAYKIEDLTLAVQTILGRLSGDIQELNIADLVRYHDDPPATLISGAL